MEFIADLHIHSKYSRATAKNLDLENLYYTAQMKGVRVVGTGDFTYPAWIKEIESKLEQTEPGLFSLKKEIARDIDKTLPETCRKPVRFILQTEISNIYKKYDQVRKNHNLIYFPDIKSVKKFNARLDAIGNIKSDGRPILGLDAADLLKIMLDTNDQGFFVPAHIWTPWFSMFGSKSGFDSIEACFGSLSSHIFAVETGLSSDPPMNWRIKDLDRLRLISNSDAHSPGYLGRNASVFNTDLSFFHIRKALETNDLDAYQGTLDMYPHQGKYHYDGHRKCNVCLNPAQTAEMDGICPECGRKVTYGVLNRVQELAARPEGFMPENRHGYRNIVPLADVLAEIFEVGPKTKKVNTYYHKAVETLGPELGILLDKSPDEIRTANVPLLAEAIVKIRSGDIRIDPGYDGEYGRVNIFSQKEKERLKGGSPPLFDLPVKKKKSVSGKRVKRRTVQAQPQKNLPKRPVHLQDQDLLAGLNAAQQKAVDSCARAMVIQAGPGTGKTRTLTAKIAHLVSNKKVDPCTILALTFTNKAAHELEHRIKAYLPGSTATVLATTFHSFCLGLLKEHKGFKAAIMDDPVRMALIKDAFEEPVKQGQIHKMDRLISQCKQNLLGPEDNLETIAEIENPSAVKTVYSAYQRCCEKQNRVDFEDLIFMTMRMLDQDENIRSQVQKQYAHVFIDEYQDLNFAQYCLARLVSKNAQIVVIGDPDQSIYGFRGSDNVYFKRFSLDFPGCEKIRLTQNYRSTQTILDASFQLMSRSLDTREKIRIFSGVDSPRKLIIKSTATARAEAVSIGKMIESLVGGISFFSMDTDAVNLDNSKEYSFSDFAVLYRTGRQCETFIHAFEKAGIPFQTADKKNLFDVIGIRELVSLCRIMAGCESFQDVHLVFNYLGAGLGKKGLACCREAYETASVQGLEILPFFMSTPVCGLRQPSKKKMIQIAAHLHGLGQAVNGQDAQTCVRVLCEKAGLIIVIEENERAGQVFETLLSMAQRHTNLKDLLDALALNQDADALSFKSEKVSLMTLHAAKGLEFPVVFVAGCEQGLVPFSRDGRTIDDPEEERRLFYVAMTRAMDILCLTYAKKRSIYGSSLKRQRSFFIDDIEKKLTQVEPLAARMPVKKKDRQMELF